MPEHPIDRANLSTEALLGSFGMGLFYYYLTSLVVFLGLAMGSDLIPPNPNRGHTFGYTDDVYANWDGQWYTKIAAEGYSFDQTGHSTVAFFPAYPLLGRVIGNVLGLRYDKALLLESNTLLLATFILLVKYTQWGFEETPPRFAECVLLAFGLAPTSFFFRVVYSESLFAFLTILALYGIKRRWPPVALAVVVGLATATRPVGVGLIPPLVLYAWHRCEGTRSYARFIKQMIYIIPLSCWGLAGYIAYQWLVFGEPLAFIKAQINWKIRADSTLWDRFFSLATLEPIRTLYNPSSRFYWGTLSHSRNPLLNLRAFDAIFFLGTTALVILGATKRWLSRYEIAVTPLLLIIPYITIGYDQYMQSMARYSAAVIPVYLVLGHLLCRLPAHMVAAIASISGCVLGFYSAMFAAWRLFL